MNELSTALKDVLEKRGVLSEVKAKLRADVYKALDDKSISKPKLSRENFLLNELIRDYLAYNQYNYTASVLLAETGQPEEALNKDFLARELGMKEDGSSIPLLYRMLACFLQGTTLEDQQDGQKLTTLYPNAVPSGDKRADGTWTIEEPTYHNTS